MNGGDRGRSRDEASWERAEQQLFAERARVAPAPPPFRQVLAASRWGEPKAAPRPPWLRREDAPGIPWAPWVGLGLAAAVSGLCVLPRGSVDQAPATEVVAELLPSSECYEDPATSGDMPRAVAFGDTLAGAEGQPADVRECALPVESDVACVAYRPLDEEVLEDRSRGQSVQ